MKKFLCLAVLLFAGCTDAEWDHTFNYGESQIIDLYSGGNKVATWTSTGRINNDPNTDGYVFRDKATGKYTIVRGDVVIQAAE